MPGSKSLEVVSGAHLTPQQIIDQRASGEIPATRSAHIGSLNPHTTSVALSNIARVVLHENIFAGDSGYPTTQIQVGGAEITVSNDDKILAPYARFRKGNFRVDLSPAGTQIIRAKIQEALRPSSVAMALVGPVAQAALALPESLGTFSFSAQPSEVLSPRILGVFTAAQTPAQMHYLACRAAPGMGQNVESVARMLTGDIPEVTQDILTRFQSDVPTAFAEFNTTDGRRLTLSGITRYTMTYTAGTGETVVIPRETVAQKAMDYLLWEAEAVTNPKVDPTQNPQAGPVLSGLAYVTLLTAADLIASQKHPSLLQDAPSVVRHIGGNSMHDYMLTDDGSPARQEDLNQLYQAAQRALKDRLPRRVVMELVPGKELSILGAGVGLVGQAVQRGLTMYAQWQDANIPLKDAHTHTKSELLSRFGVSSPSELDAPRLIEVINSLNPDTHGSLIQTLSRRLDKGVTPAIAQEIFGKAANAHAEILNQGLKDTLRTVEAQVSTFLGENPLSRALSGQLPGATYSQYDVLDSPEKNPSPLPSVVASTGFNEMPGIINWWRNRVSGTRP